MADRITSLAITRKDGESVLIGNNVRVTNVVCGDKGPRTIRLLIEAPESVKILREELVKCDDSTK